MNPTSVRWERVRESLTAAGRRVADLLRGVPDPEAPGTGEWTAAQTAAHLSHSFAANLSAVRGVGPAHLPHLSAPVGAVEKVSDFNAANLEMDPERDLKLLASRIEETAAQFLAHTADAAGDEPVTWLRGAKLSVSGVACHWIGESLLHGFDIARGSGLRWVIEPAWAGLWFAGFTVPVVDAFEPHTLVDQQKANGLNARVDMRVRGAGRALFVLENGTLRVEAPPGKADCHVSVDPATNLLLSWARISPLRAMVTGRLFVWGRRPQQALQLTRVLTTP